MSFMKKLRAVTEDSTIGEAVSEDKASAGGRHRGSASATESDVRSETGSENVPNRGLMLLRRRMSNWKNSKQSSSLSRGVFGKIIPETVKMENTYRLQPGTAERFSPSKVETVIKNVLQQYLSDLEYNPRICSRMSQRISDEIKKRVKLLNCPRYKIVCYVMIGQKRDQTVQYVSRCLWDEKNDSFASARFENKTMFATATVFGTYFE